MAANFYLYSHKKVMSLVPVESPEGQEKGALAYLFDTLLRSHAGRPMILDFNTSDDEGLAPQLGADQTYYFRWRRQDMRWWRFW